jgi:hypothetical protein
MKSNASLDMPTVLLLIGHQFTLASSLALLSNLRNDNMCFQTSIEKIHKLCTIHYEHYLLQLSFIKQRWGGGGHAAGLCSLLINARTNHFLCAFCAFLNQCSNESKKQVNARKISKAVERMDKLQDRRHGNSTSEQQPVG